MPDRVIFDHVVAALAQGAGDERIASPGYSDRPFRRRVRQWAAAGLTARLHVLVLTQYDRMLGLALHDVAIAGCITKAPSRGDIVGRSTVDRRNQGLKRSTVTDATGVPLYLHLGSAGACRHDAPPVGLTVAGLARLRPRPPAISMLLDRGDDRGVVRARLAKLGVGGEIARRACQRQCR